MNRSNAESMKHKANKSWKRMKHHFLNKFFFWKNKTENCSKYSLFFYGVFTTLSNNLDRKFWVMNVWNHWKSAKFDCFSRSKTQNFLVQPVGIFQHSHTPFQKSPSYVHDWECSTVQRPSHFFTCNKRKIRESKI